MTKPTSANPLLSPEDLAALAHVGKVRHGRAVRHVRETGLKPWMRQFAAWFALEGNALTRPEQLQKCRFFAKDRMRPHTMLALLRRPDFQEMVERFTENAVEGLRAQLEAIGPKAVEATEKAIAWAVEKEDYKAIPSVTEPVLSRLIPKKDDAPQRPPVLIVNLGTGFGQKYADAEMQECEVEELPAPTEDTDAAS